jgi:hypothetical protein
VLDLEQLDQPSLLRTSFLSALFTSSRLFGTVDGTSQEFFPRVAGLRWFARRQNNCLGDQKS